MKKPILLTIRLNGFRLSAGTTIPLTRSDGQAAASEHDVTERVLGMSFEELIEIEDGNHIVESLIPQSLKDWINSVPPQFHGAIQFTAEVEESLYDFLESVGVTRANLTAELWESIQFVHSIGARHTVSLFKVGDDVCLDDVTYRLESFNALTKKFRLIATSGDLPARELSADDIESSLNSALDTAGPVGTQIKPGRGMERFTRTRVDVVPEE